MAPVQIVMMTRMTMKMRIRMKMKWMGIAIDGLSQSRYEYP